MDEATYQYLAAAIAAACRWYQDQWSTALEVRDAARRAVDEWYLGVVARGPAAPAQAVDHSRPDPDEEVDLGSMVPDIDRPPTCRVCGRYISPQHGSGAREAMTCDRCRDVPTA